MIALTQPTRSSVSVHPFWILSIFFLPVYLVFLFIVGAMTSMIQGMILLKAKFRLTVFLGGGFSGLAAWFTVMLHHRAQYDWLIGFLNRFMSENWAKITVDSILCWLGATLFVLVIVGTQRTAKTLVAKVRGKAPKTDEAEDADKVANEDTHN